MTIASGSTANAADLLHVLNATGLLLTGNYADAPANPSAGTLYFAVDSAQILACMTGSGWTAIAPVSVAAAGGGVRVLTRSITGVRVSGGALITAFSTAVTGNTMGNSGALRVHWNVTPGVRYLTTLLFGTLTAASYGYTTATAAGVATIQNVYSCGTAQHCFGNNGIGTSYANWINTDSTAASAMLTLYVSPGDPGSCTAASVIVELLP